MNIKKSLKYLFSDTLKLNIFTKKNMKEDPKKIQKTLDKLNENGGPWIPLKEYRALIRAEIKDKQFIFTPYSGLVVQTFVDTTTGEIKFFPRRMFLKDKDEK